MIAIGSALAALGALYLSDVVAPAGGCRATCGSTAAVSIAGPLAFVALISGWITTEVGRQPWIVYETMRTADAVTAAGGVRVAFVGVVAVYIGLGAAVVWLLRRLARAARRTPRSASR